MLSSGLMAKGLKPKVDEDQNSTLCNDCVNV